MTEQYIKAWMDATDLQIKCIMESNKCTDDIAKLQGEQIDLLITSQKLLNERVNLLSETLHEIKAILTEED